MTLQNVEFRTEEATGNNPTRGNNPTTFARLSNDFLAMIEQQPIECLDNVDEHSRINNEILDPIFI